MTTIDNIISEVIKIKDQYNVNFGWSILKSNNDILIVVTRVENLDDKLNLCESLKNFSNTCFDWYINWALSSTVSVSPTLTNNFQLIATL